ncbi:MULTISPECIES: hypothetical protein [unclassified Pseudoalteromonas]|nr:MULTISPECIES: hypothetical protein [unclassified Pseudoalteromonas]
MGKKLLLEKLSFKELSDGIYMWWVITWLDTSDLITYDLYQPA